MYNYLPAHAMPTAMTAKRAGPATTQPKMPAEAATALPPPRTRLPVTFFFIASLLAFVEINF